MLSAHDVVPQAPYRSSLEAKQLNSPSELGLQPPPQSIVWTHPVHDRDDDRKAVDSEIFEGMAANPLQSEPQSNVPVSRKDLSAKGAS